MRFQGSKNRTQIDQKSIKNECKMGIALGIDFSWIFIDFRRQVGAKLASKIDRKSMQKNIQKMMANKRHLGGVLEASWRSKRCEEARKGTGGPFRPGGRADVRSLKS